MMGLLMEDATPGDRALFLRKAPLPAGRQSASGAIAAT